MVDPEIDIVIPWVDGSDPEWQAVRAEYSGETDLKETWFRDWGLLPYVFRGIEKFAPWIRKVHFVTWGHLPDWLNTECEKLHIVKHEDYIPKEYLPTFNSNAIELNFHRIPDLAENFILFNDDMFIISSVQPSDFYQNGLPRRYGIHVPNRLNKDDFFYYPVNNTAIINEHFNMRKSVLGNITKWINPCYGTNNFSTLLMLAFPAFYGFYEAHLPVPYQKATFKRVWGAESNILKQESSNRFRTSTGVSHWLVENWSVAEGAFYPQSKKYGRAFYGNDLNLNNLHTVIDYITKQRGKLTCINDGEIDEKDFDEVVLRIKQAFETILPNPSSFEKQAGPSRTQPKKSV